MWKLQGGSYIPGFSGQAYGAGLQRDVIKTRKDQAKKARALRKYMNKRGVMGKWGGRLASGLLGAALGSTMGPVGLMIAKAGGAGLGSLIGGSERLSGKGPSMASGAGTGLLGSGYEQLSEAKGGINEAMRGQALGAGVSQLASGLAGMAGDKLGEAFKQTRAGVRMGELQSGYGKMMAGKGINIGEALPEAEQVTDLEGTGLAGGFDWGDAPSNQLTEDLSWYDKAPEAYLARGQQGGYMQGYQDGGQIDYSKTAGLYNRFLAEADSSEIMSGQDINRWRALQNLESSSPEMYDAQSDVGRRFLKDASLTQSLINPKAMEGISQEDRYKLVQGLSPEGRKLYYSQYFDDSEGKQQGGYMQGYQQGGMMPGGVSNALPYHRGGSVHPHYDWSDDVEFDEDMQTGGYLSRYNLGGSVTQQPMAYQLGGLLKYRRSPMMG